MRKGGLHTNNLYANSPIGLLIKYLFLHKLNKQENRDLNDHIGCYPSV